MNEQIRLREEIERREAETKEYLVTHKVKPTTKSRLVDNMINRIDSARSK